MVDHQGCASISNILLMRPKLLRSIDPAPRYVIKEIIQSGLRIISRHHHRLKNHPKLIFAPLLQTCNNRRLKRK